ncbi:MAG: ATP-dependent DNA ligase [Myxococcota bacterium]
MQLSRLVQSWSSLRATRSRNEKKAVLAALLKEASSDEIGLAVSYLVGSLPRGKIGLGYATVRKATDDLDEHVGGSLELEAVEASFGTIAELRGPGSSGERLKQLRALLTRVSDAERNFLSRLIVGELRQGASEGVMCDAIAAAAEIDAASVRRAFMVSGNLAGVAAAALQLGKDGLDDFEVELFVPLRPMLAQPADDVQAALEELGEARFEYKIDGARIQVHKRGSEVRVYSRAMNEVTSSVPEVVELAHTLPADSLILDGEAIAMRRDGRPHPFQTTMRRFGRRRDVAALREELPLSVFLFDLLYLDGTPLIDDPLRVRIDKLSSLSPEACLPPAYVTNDIELAEAHWQRALDQGHEGLMAKSLESPYEAGNRGSQWLKLKPAHTLDLVVIAAEWGSGRRKGWLSNLHLAAHDPEHESFVMLGKTFKGLTDELLEWQTRELLARETERDEYVVHVRPELVVEVAFNNVQQSPRYPGGLALRFARVKRYRPDKTPQQADVIATVRETFDRSRA